MPSVFLDCDVLCGEDKEVTATRCPCGSYRVKPSTYPNKASALSVANERPITDPIQPPL